MKEPCSNIILPLLFFSRHVVHAKMEEIRFSPPVGSEGLSGHSQDVHLPTLPSLQPPPIQTRPLGWIHSRSLRALAFSENRALQGSS